jgi:hypothetical protein
MISMGPGGSYDKIVGRAGTPMPGTTLTCAGLSLSDGANGNRGRLELTFYGPTQFDHLTVNGPVDVSGATLVVFFTFVPSLGDSYLIVDNDGSDPIIGTFAGLPEGATFVLGGRTFQITYVGGTGNDIVLTVTSVVPVGLQGFEVE